MCVCVGGGGGGGQCPSAAVCLSVNLAPLCSAIFMSPAPPPPGP